MPKTKTPSRNRLLGLGAIAAVLVWLNLSDPTSSSTTVQAVVKPPNNTRASFALPFTGATSPSTTAAPQATGPSFGTSGVHADLSLPTKLVRPLLELAKHDPFAPPPPPPVVAPKPAPVIAAPIVAPPAPMAPPLNLVFAGRVTSPDGLQSVYVLFGETSLTLKPGLTLPNGYRLESMTAQSAEFSYPPLNTTARLEFPAAPKYEIR